MPRARVLLLVTGGIAAYKAAHLTRLLVQAGFSVRVAMTRAAQRFVAPMTFQALSEHPVATDLWGEGATEPMDHIGWAQWADLAVVSPATANILAKMAHGIADDMVTTLLLACRGPVVVAPAMNDAMWEHPATGANLAILRERGVTVCGPAAGELACGTTGPGRMVEPDALVTCIEGKLAQLPARPEPEPAAFGGSAADISRAWAGRRVVITAGPTWEPVDPVRYVANRSTGLFGFALATEAVRRGAEVTLIAGPTGLADPPGAATLRVETTEQMAAAVADAMRAGADWLFMAAAVADFKPARIEVGKLKKESIGTSWNLEMTRTVDILGDVVGPEDRGGLRVVGFALETDDLIARATVKMKAKGMNFIVANDLSAPDSAFGAGMHYVTLIGPDGPLWDSDAMTKEQLAVGLLDRLGEAATGS